MRRKKFLKRLAILGGIAAIPGLYAWQVEPFWLEFVRHKMPVKNLPKHLYGKSLMQISDVHIGDFFDYQYIIDSFKRAQQLDPDFVVYTGDFVTYEEPKNPEISIDTSHISQEEAVQQVLLYLENEGYLA